LLIFSEEPIAANTEDYFVAGTVNTDQQIRENGFSDLKNLPMTT